MSNLGLTMHVGRVLNKMMSRANCEDGLESFCVESQSLEDLYKEVDEESGYTRNYGRAIAIVRNAYGVANIQGIKQEDAEDIESGQLAPSRTALAKYAKALGLSLDDFLYKVDFNLRLLMGGFDE